MSEEHLSGVACPVCGSAGVVLLLEILQMPVHCNVLWPTAREALDAPRGDIRLGHCRECGHIFNLAFDPRRMEYTQAYENSLHFSPRFQEYANALAKRLIERYDLHGKDIIEIGSGKGEFLTMLCQLGDNRGVGFDPSYVAEDVARPQRGQTTFVQDFYSESYADLRADLICCRHVLEHVDDPVRFLTAIRSAIHSRLDTRLFFEVPNVLYTLRDQGIWDIIYEHCSYYSPGSLGRLFMECGFDVHHIDEAFGGQFLYIEAAPAGTPGLGYDASQGLQAMAPDVAAFSETYADKTDAWRRDLQRIADAGQRAVVWGAGSKGVTFLNTLKATEQIDTVVDVNPRKQGMFVAGTGQPIVAPSHLPHEPPEIVIVMNAMYKDEIRRMTRELGLDPSFRCA